MFPTRPIFLLLVVTNVFAGDHLPSGHAKLLDWDEAHQGFSFESRSPAGSEMDFFIADRGEESVIHAFDAPGVIDMGSIPLSQIKTAPENGYKNTVQPLQGHSYVLRSKGIYAKIYLQEIFFASDYSNRPVTEYEFNWVIQPNGTRNFEAGVSSSSSQVGTKESLGKVLEATASELNWKGTIATMPWRDFESVFWTGIVENRTVTMGIIIHDSEKLADEDLELFGESGYGYSPSKFKNYPAFISKSGGKTNGIYWRMGKFVLYVTDSISEKHLYETANVLYSRASSSPVISESEMEKERDSEGEEVEEKTIGDKGGAQGQSQSSSGENGTAIGDAAVDLDGDGIDDSIDQCPDTPLGAKVDSKGCKITDKVLIEQDDFQLESGQIVLTHEWTEVSFAKPFAYPVVVAKPLSYNGTDPATVAIKDVSSQGFKVRIQEWPHIEGSHTEETLSYLAVERGHFSLDSGLEIEADVIYTNITSASKETTPQGAQHVNFFSGFSANPIVFGARTSFNGEDTVATRIDNVTGQGFNVLMQEQEANEQSHAHETISYIALSEGFTRIGEETLVVRRVKVNHEPYTVNLPSGIKVKVFLDEEGSLDEETDHSEESVGYLSFSGRPLLFFADIQTIEDSDTANLRYEEVSGNEKQAHTVIIDGSVKSDIVTEYRLEVTGSIEPVDGNLEGHEVSFNPSDSINGKTATGRVDRGKDGFKVTGQITSIELNHPEATVVLIDGEKVREIDTSGTSQGKSTGTVTLKHWGGEGSYEEGFDFSEGGVQRDGENGPDKPSLNPDFFYTGSWERSFPTRVAHDATQPLKRIDYGKVTLGSVDKVFPPSDPRFKEGHLKVGHVYGFYTREESYVLLKVQSEEEIPREDWHVGALTFSWKLLEKNTRKPV